MAGTAMHAAVEAFLRGEIEQADMPAFAEARAHDAATFGVLQKDGTTVPLTYSSFSGPDEMIFHAANCTRGWIADVCPYLQANDYMEGDAEVGFQFDAFEHRDWTIQFEGTCDWIPRRGNEIIDWKTGTESRYKQADKQRYSIQGTVYTAAAVAGCFGREFAWPVDFTYGVAIRLKTKFRGITVTIQRNQEYWSWLAHRVRQLVDMFLDLGLDKPWPMVDESFSLCSRKWCSFYDSCRGAHISAQSDLYGWAQAA